MIIYSDAGVRPHEDAIKAIRGLKKHGIVFIRDGKYVSVPSPSDDVLADVFDNKRPYCLCEDAHKNTKKVPGCFNPFIICASGKDNLYFYKKKMYPLGAFFLHDKVEGVRYSNLTWVPKPQLNLVKNTQKKADTTGMNHQQKQVLSLFTNDFEIMYATWSYTKKKWERTYNKGVVEPYDYMGIFYVGKQGGWMIYEDQLGVDFASMPYGLTRNKTIGKIEKYITKVIKETKDVVRKQVAFDYYDKVYYENEIQAAWVVLSIARMLKSHYVKISRESFAHVMKRIALYRKPTLDPSEAMDVYMIQHIDKIVNHIL